MWHICLHHKSYKTCNVINLGLFSFYALIMFLAIDWKDGKKHKYGRLSEPPSQYQGMNVSGFFFFFVGELGRDSSEKGMTNK